MPRHEQIPGTTAEWLARARADLAMAKAPLPEGAVYEALCFHAQQATEKAIKAVFRSRHQGFEYTYNIGHLLHGLERLGLLLPQGIEDSVQLTDYASRTNYPGTGEPVSREEYEHAVDLAERVVHWATTVIER